MVCVCFVMYWCCWTIIGAVEPLNTLCWRVWQCLSCTYIRMVDAFNQQNCCPIAISDFDFDLYIRIFKSLFGITRNWYFIFYLQNIFLLCVSSASGWWWFCFCLKDYELINEIVFLVLFNFVLLFLYRCPLCRLFPWSPPWWTFTWWSHWPPLLGCDSSPGLL